MKNFHVKALSFCLICILVCSLLPTSVGAVTVENESSPPGITASAALLVEMTDDTVLYDKAAEETRYPASITKIMTALLTLEAIEASGNSSEPAEGIGTGKLTLDQMITASDASVADMTDDSSTQNIRPGETMSVNDLLHCLLISSANEAANILGEAVSGSVEAFVERMNQRAAELGMTGTHFANPHGLHRDNHYSTAHDIYLMTKEAMKYPLFREIVSTVSYQVPATNLSEPRNLFTTNALLSNRKYAGYTYSYCIGVKTGSTPEAGYCLVAAAEKGERILISVVLGAENVTQSNHSVARKQFSESSELLSWGMTAFRRVTVLDSLTYKKEIPVKVSSGLPYVVVQPSRSVETTLPSSFDTSQLQTNVQLKKEQMKAPVKKGEVLGTISVSYNGAEFGSADLIAVSDVNRSFFLWILDILVTFFSSLPVRIALIAALFLLLIHLIQNGSLRGKRKKNSRPPTSPPPPQRPRSASKNQKRRSHPKSPSPHENTRPKQNNTTGRGAPRHR